MLVIVTVDTIIDKSIFGRAKNTPERQHVGVCTIQVPSFLFLKAPLGARSGALQVFLLHVLGDVTDVGLWS